MAHTRSYTTLWAIILPVSIFNNDFAKYLDGITDVSVHGMISGHNRAFMIFIDSHDKRQSSGCFYAKFKII